jgi:hypothetical protein
MYSLIFKLYLIQIVIFCLEERAEEAALLGLAAAVGLIRIATATAAAAVLALGLAATVALGRRAAVGVLGLATANTAALGAAVGVVHGVAATDTACLVVAGLVGNLVRRVLEGVEVVVVEVGVEAGGVHDVGVGRSVEAVGTVVQQVVGGAIDGIVEGVRVADCGQLGGGGRVVRNNVEALVNGIRGTRGGLGHVLEAVGSVVDGLAGTTGNEAAGHGHQHGGAGAANNGGDRTGSGGASVLRDLGRCVGKRRGVLAQLGRGIRQLLADGVQGIGNRLRGLNRVLEALASTVDRGRGRRHIDRVLLCRVVRFRGI